MFKTVMWLFAIYIVTECFVAFYKMDGGDKFCRVAKYFMTACVGCVGVGISYKFQFQPEFWLWLVPDLAVALFLWPTTYARFTGGFKNRIGDV